ncbi:MAG TPA: 1-deoxy-D-xylulose-5-phosphate reductoisomerase [Candidatus Sphingobacterium stercorigallinarum]|nr:1-deoxy-D-xylulose-5-phosphate reductoisomerase [Candidatus Sphingobacterium stercorigallinarum]
MTHKRIAILGSTGSIGTQSLEVISQFPESFSVTILTAGKNADLLIRQAHQFKPKIVVLSDQQAYQTAKEALMATDIEVRFGEDALEEVMGVDCFDLVITALVGSVGLRPTVAAIEAGKDVALANKETLVVAGDLITALVEKHGVKLLPVDSEHSAIFQCLVGERNASVEKVILTASGGPFRGWERADLVNVTKKQALRHPNWTMGAKITIDSASMMNKGLEVIEARWLFGISPEQIDVIVHPQSIVHSLVQFCDGSLKAQLGIPDMKLPILYALGYPERMNSSFERFDFLNYPQLTFERVDLEVFKNLKLAFQALNAAGNSACVLNAANEVAVDAFLSDRIGFLRMSEVIEETLCQVSYRSACSLDDYIQDDRQSRSVAWSLINKS